MFHRVARLSTMFFMSSLSLAHAADIVAAKDPMPFVNTNDITWSGFYIGGQTGWIKSDIKYKQQDDLGLAGDYTYTFYTEGPYDTNHFKDNLFSGGIYAGYNFALSKHWIVGLEGDIALFKTDDRNEVFERFGPPYTQDEVDWRKDYCKMTYLCDPNVRIADRAYLIQQNVESKRSAALRGRIGYTSDNYMIFATAGVATAKVNYNLVLDGGIVENRTSLDNDRSLTGYTVGGGVEYALTRNLLFRTEYRYTDYGSENFSFNDSVFWDKPSFDVDYKTHEVRLGIAYKFH